MYSYLHSILLFEYIYQLATFINLLIYEVCFTESSEVDCFGLKYTYDFISSTKNFNFLYRKLVL